MWRVILAGWGTSSPPRAAMRAAFLTEALPRSWLVTLPVAVRRLAAHTLPGIEVVAACAHMIAIGAAEPAGRHRGRPAASRRVGQCVRGVASRRRTLWQHRTQGSRFGVVIPHGVVVPHVAGPRLRPIDPVRPRSMAIKASHRA